jgi:hypothetical protein
VGQSGGAPEHSTWIVPAHEVQILPHYRQDAPDAGARRQSFSYDDMNFTASSLSRITAATLVVEMYRAFPEADESARYRL